MSFFFLPPTSALLTSVVGMEESLDFLESLLSLCCFFSLFLLALSEDLESWVEVDMGVDAGPLEALESSPQFTTPCV